MNDAAEGRGGPGALLVCPTPIGNLEDITLRVLGVLASADVIACEDTRRTRTLLAHHGIAKTAVVSFHEHNERRRAPELVARIRAGDTIALVSDAGMPVISDPGFLLVRACIEAGIRVEVLPGASAAPVALVASGLPPARYLFVGFLPRKRGERTRLFATATETVVAFESPARLTATLELLADVDPARAVAICRELSKLHEEVLRGSAAELAQKAGTRTWRGEVVLVIGSAQQGARSQRVPGGREAPDSLQAQ
ncbi:MAG: 16S rRNA (cytidine(1402)-2'-O)-methyltransferase [Solirubrobacteraceae bacterium]